MSETGPSRDREAPVRPRSWVILASIPNVVGDEKFQPGTDVMLEVEDPPRTTIVTVPKRVAPDAMDSLNFPYVVNACPSGRFLLYTTHRGRVVYYLCDAHSSVATRLPDSTEPRILPMRSVGLIEDPHHRGHYMAAQLHPTSSEHHETLIYHYTGAKVWAVKELASSPHHQAWDSHGGALAHDGKLWWVDLAYGLLTCDPFVSRPDLRYVPLPEVSVMADANNPSSRGADLDKQRCVKVSEDKLCYIEIHGLLGEPTVTMWTLCNPEGPDYWKHEYNVRFKDIWAEQSYTAAGLPSHKVPAIALIHPKNYGIVYFFLGSNFFSVNMRATERRVLECENLQTRHEFHTARFVHAWELPPTFLQVDGCENDRNYNQIFGDGMVAIGPKMRGFSERPGSFGNIMREFGGSLKMLSTKSTGPVRRLIDNAGTVCIDIGDVSSATSKVLFFGGLAVGGVGAGLQEIAVMFPVNPIPAQAEPFPYTESDLYDVFNVQDAEDVVNLWKIKGRPDNMTVDVPANLHYVDLVGIMKCFIKEDAIVLLKRSRYYTDRRRECCVLSSLVRLPLLPDEVTHRFDFPSNAGPSGIDHGWVCLSKR